MVSQQITIDKQNQSTFKASACISAHIPMFKANHVARPKVTGAGKYTLPQAERDRERVRETEVNGDFLSSTSIYQNSPSY